MNLATLLQTTPTNLFTQEQPPRHEPISLKHSSIEDIVALAREHDDSDVTEELVRNLYALAQEPNRHGYLVGFANPDQFTVVKDKASKRVNLVPRDQSDFLLEYRTQNPKTLKDPSYTSLLQNAQGKNHDWMHLYASTIGLFEDGVNHHRLGREGVDLRSLDLAQEADFADAGGSSAGADYAARAQKFAFYARSPCEFRKRGFKPYLTAFEPVMHNRIRAVRVHIVTPDGTPPSGERQHVTVPHSDVISLPEYRREHTNSPALYAA